ncbi:MAG: RNA polymerase sigma factor [Planctomycetes bacterium]|nr:RNA polymerase sigma factor [Planctomycetota bacterium]
MARTDKELMLLFQRGEDAAFEELVVRYQVPVVNFAYRAIGDRARAEDLAQEAFIRVYRARSRYEPTASFTTWLFTIVNRLCMNEIRSRRREARAIREPFTRPGASVNAAVLPGMAGRTPDSPEEALEREERASLVREAILSLPPNQRQAVLLRRYEDLSYEEIARAIGVSVKAVKSLLVRARENLRKALEPYLRGGGRRPAATRGVSGSP